MLQYGYKEGELYRQSLALTTGIYRLTEGFPDTERMVLAYTLRRLAGALCQQLATGLMKKGKKRKQALLSCIELCIALDMQLEIALAVNLFAHEAAGDVEKNLESIYKAVSNLIATNN